MSSAPSRRSGGFTLLELIVVLAIVGILVGLAMPSLSGVGVERLPLEEARRMRALLALASDEAALTGRTYGLLLHPRGYRFLARDDGFSPWQDAENEGVFRSRSLPSPVSLRLWQDEHAVGLLANVTEPQVLLYASGEMTPFRVEFPMVNATRQVSLKGRLTGGVDLLQEPVGATRRHPR
ncbi:MAG: type II secretion system minor pseudopilin GspH [Magnetococcus sp. WYHC-3]